MPSTERDFARLHQALAEVNCSITGIPKRKAIRPIADVCFDWLVIFSVIGLVIQAQSLLVWLMAFAIIGNRQRALGNLFHDAAHSNLLPSRKCNDAIARFALSPAMLVEFRAYRRSHAMHHSHLGQKKVDPDLIDVPEARRTSWLAAYGAELFSVSMWLGNVMGDLRAPRRNSWAIIEMLIWWGLFYAVLDVEVSARYAVDFAIGWWVARATVFHAITTFREMCDHFGLQPNGVFSFTRDVHTSSLLRFVVHPHNNGYHLTHHLIPTVPYHQLPAVQSLLCTLPIYAEGTCCDAYLFGMMPVVNGWARGDSFD